MWVDKHQMLQWVLGPGRLKFIFVSKFKGGLCGNLKSTRMFDLFTSVDAGLVEGFLDQKGPLGDAGSFHCVWPVGEKFLDRREGLSSCHKQS